jgi:hypothetical protein
VSQDKGPQKVALRQRMTRKVVNAAGGGIVDELFARISELEAEVQENRNLNVRVAELVDLVAELMLPIASQDRAKIDEALAKFERSL